MELDVSAAAESAEDVVRAYADTVYALAFAQTHSRSDADDVFQEVFLAYMRKAPQFAGEEHRKAWFLRVTLNCCKKLWRTRSRHSTVPLEESLAFQTRDETVLCLELAKLPPKYRAVIHLFYYEGLSTGEIAQVTGASPGAVRTRLSRARDMLREQLRDEL